MSMSITHIGSSKSLLKKCNLFHCNLKSSFASFIISIFEILFFKYFSCSILYRSPILTANTFTAIVLLLSEIFQLIDVTQTE